MYTNRFTGILILLCAALPAAAAANIEGLWRTVDDKTHEPRGVVRIYKEHGQFFGKIVQSFNPKEAREVCGKCDGAMRGKPIIGLVILREMREHGNEYSGGTIVDPETGESYRCKMTVGDAGRKLTVRGYVGFALFGRTQVWTRYTPPKPMRETGGE